MLDVAVSYNRFRFLGHEFLTWLWHTIENDLHLLKSLDDELTALEIGNRIVLENRRDEALESIIIQGDEAGFEEGILALKKGAMVTELNLFYKAGDKKWQFTLKGESLSITNLKTPETSIIETSEDVEGAVLDKIYLYERVVRLLDSMFNAFIKIRVSNEWNTKALPDVKKWISEV
ncbi:MAG: hypothetical protein JRI53_03645 [Deltaproteobacteria bacterium]|nr:hypothetical protein [Deltaproteobacteria bacterium]